MTAISLTQYRQAAQEVPFLWEPSVDQLAERLWHRSLRRGWHLPLRYYDELRKHWSAHAGPLQPTGVTLRLGRGLTYDWDQAVSWIQDEAALRGVGFNTDYAIRSETLHSCSDDAVRFDRVMCAPVGFDFTGDVVTDESPSILPGVDVLWLLALNPNYLFAMDEDRLPYLTIPGLRVGRVGMPVIGRGSTGIFIYAAHRSNYQAGAPSRYRPLV